MLYKNTLNFTMTDEILRKNFSPKIKKIDVASAEGLKKKEVETNEILLLIKYLFDLINFY